MDKLRWESCLSVALHVTLLASLVWRACGESGRDQGMIFRRPGNASGTHHAPRIVGGSPEPDTDIIAWQAVILRNNVVHCGGTVIAYNKVLTAAHCDINVKYGRHTLIIGSGKISKGKTYQILKVYNHENFHRGEQDEPISDVAVLEFANNNPKIVPYYPRLNANNSLPTASSPVFISGFGRTALGGPSSDVLLSVRVPLVPSATCTQQYNGLDMTNNICAGSTAADSCQGDSGGGLWLRDRRNRTDFVIMGIASYGAGCAMFNSPGVYVRVSRFRKWIVEKANAPPAKFPRDTLRQIVIWGSACGAAIVLAGLVWFAVALVRKGKKATLVHFDDENLERYEPDQLGAV